MTVACRVYDLNAFRAEKHRQAIEEELGAAEAICDELGHVWVRHWRYTEGEWSPPVDGDAWCCECCADLVSSDTVPARWPRGAQ